MMMLNVDVLDKSIQKTNAWIREIMSEGGWEDPNTAYRALRTVLHALRDRLNPEEAMDLGAQLPLLIRGIFYEGWVMSGKPLKLRSKEEFLERIDMEIPNQFIDPEMAARTVFKVLAKKISEGEVKDIKGTLPKEILSLWSE